MIPKKAVFKRAHQELKDKSFIDGYLKGKQLGRGGFSKVWEGFHFKTKKFYAIKEIDTTNKYQTHLTEIWFGNHFFEYGGVPKR
jgi:serine/threonine protein kinase